MKHREQILLLQVIAETGDCDHVRHYECRSCPLGRWKKREDGSYISCLEVTNALAHPDGYKAAYSKAAAEAVADLAVLHLLGVNDEES